MSRVDEDSETEDYSTEPLATSKSNSRIKRRLESADEFKAQDSPKEAETALRCSSRTKRRLESQDENSALDKQVSSRCSHIFHSIKIPSNTYMLSMQV